MALEAEAVAEEAKVGEALARTAAETAEGTALAAQEEAGRWSVELAGLEEALAAALKRVAELDEILVAEQAETARVAADREQALEALAERAGEIVALPERVAAEAARADQAEKAISYLRRTIEESGQTNAALQERLADERTELAEARARMEETVAQRDHLRVQATERDERIRVCEDAHARARAEVAALTARLAAEQASSQAAAELAERNTIARVAEVRALHEERIAELRRQHSDEASAWETSSKPTKTAN